MTVAYIDARLVIERLNLVCPHLWATQFKRTQNGMLCYLTVDGITRPDVGDGRDEKAMFSDALKRAAVHFGVGVSLYAIPKVWVEKSHLKQNGTLNPEGERYTRSAYASWLDMVGTKAFGEPLDHGDAEDAQGDVEVGA